MSSVTAPQHDLAQVIDFERVISGVARADHRPVTGPLCRECGARRPRFFVRGTVKTDHSHTLCFECYRRVVNRTRAQRLEMAGDIRFLASSLPDPAQSRPNRRVLYVELAGRRHQAQMAARHALEGLTVFEPTAGLGPSEDGELKLVS
jgi:hypothetical protein